MRSKDESLSGRMTEMTQQKIVRVTSLARVLDTIQNTLETGLTSEQKKGARWALNAVRREFGIPADGDQMELNLRGEKKK
jgi:hypothetical protein